MHWLIIASVKNNDNLDVGVRQTRRDLMQKVEKLLAEHTGEVLELHILPDEFSSLKEIREGSPPMLKGR